MSSSTPPTTTSQDLVRPTDASNSLSAEIGALIQRVVESVGRHAHLQYEADSQKLKIRTLGVAAKNAQIIKKLEQEKVVLDGKTKELQQEMIHVVQGIMTLARKYQVLYSADIDTVRTNLENGMEKFSHILSKDTLERIKTESNRIHSVVKEKITAQDETLAKIKNGANAAQQVLEKKVQAVEKAIQDKSTRQENDPQLQVKLDEIERKMTQQEQYIRGMMDGLMDRVNLQSVSMKNVSGIVSATIKEDRTNMLKRMDVIAGDLDSSKSIMHDFKTELDSLQTLADQHLKTPKESSGEFTALKYLIAKQELKSKELQRMINTLAATPDTTTTMTDLNSDSMFQRLDQLEKTVFYLKTKVEVMEPRYLQAVKEQQANNKSPSIGEKRPRPDDDQLQQLDYKLSSLIEYIHQFRSTVLNPDFPRRLDTTLQDMEKCLKNHEVFIAYLVDPVSAAHSINLSDPTPLVNNSTISPALLGSISQLVADKATNPSPELLAQINRLVTQHTDPLKKQIKDLEQKLANHT